MFPSLTLTKEKIYENILSLNLKHKRDLENHLRIYLQREKI
jgi:hypothetical protein